MFEVGDAVVYPPYGGGYIRAIEEKEFLDKKETYHVIEFLLSKELNVYVPSKLLAKKNIRYALTKDELQEKIEELELNDKDCIGMNSKPGQRNINSSKLASADIETTLNTFMTLRKKRNKDKLNQSERNVYSKCHTLLVSEIMASEHVSEKEGEAILKNLLKDYVLQP